MSKKPVELTLNALKIRFKEERITVYPSNKSTADAVKFSEKEAAELKRNFNLTDEWEDVYARLAPETPGQLSVTRAVSPEFCRENETCWSLGFLKKYCTRRLTLHFQSLGFPCRTNFVSDTEVWIKALSPYANCTGYRVITLRVQFDAGEKTPELLVIAGEIRSVYNNAVTDPVFSEMDDKWIETVVYKTEIMKYRYLSDDARRNLSEVFPCLNPPLKQLLGIPYTAPDKGNRYVKFLHEAEQFKNEYLLNSDLSGVFEIASDWKKAMPQYFETEELIKMSFGTGTHTQPKYGLPQFGPAELLDDQVVFFFIGHVDDKPLAWTINDYFLGKYSTEFKGINGYLHLKYETEPKSSIWFTDKHNPLPEIKSALKAKLENQESDSQKRYVAIYLSPHSKYGSSPAEHKIYYQVKEHLLSCGIVSQVVEAGKAWGKGRPLLPKTDSDKHDKAKLAKGFHYSFANIAVAIYAKLGGIPWSFGKQASDELVIGVSAYTNSQLGKYLGSAFSFTNEGRFQGFECFSNTQLIQLAGSIKLALMKSTQENPAIKRLIIHFYKKLSYDEIKPIQKALSELQLQIPVVVVTVNKTFSEDLVGFDLSVNHLMPASGHYLRIDKDRYLLYNNQLNKGVTDIPADREGYPFPLKISIQQYEPGSNEAKPLSEEDVVPVMQQLCRFSILYWKSVSRQWLPVTLRYPEMLAQIAPHFKYKDWGELGNESLWFL